MLIQLNKKILNWILLLIGTFILIFYHFGFFLFNEYRTNKHIRNLKLCFNKKLADKTFLFKNAKYLKILINNYSSVSDKFIFDEKTNPEIWKFYVDNLLFSNTTNWNYNTFEFNFSILFTILLPSLNSFINIIKIFIKYKQNKQKHFLIK